ncbi:putative inactive receptor kinase [Heracleum sosnowskyi]|uniref:Inactive receptor kinase n=1 Tax=Heracleum sosnowskyi TaxID=360622 RepID=A0AAD8HXL8_9APIA|nr:putative inactive receptor kinase [Heracleum sosnowskyi]
MTLGIISTTDMNWSSNNNNFDMFSKEKGYSDLTTDRAALLRLRDAVKGRTLLWNSAESTPCSWKGITCHLNNNSVIKLQLPGFGLSGEIPRNTIGNLSNLRTLSLRKNSLSGKLPEDLGSCTELQYLVLQENSFSNEIPASLFSLNKLSRLSLSNNNLSGKMSPEFNKLTQLKTLLLRNNQLTGSLPELKDLTRLSDFDVSYNNLTGSIPRFFRNFSSDNFTGNSLCGSPLGSCEEKSEESKLSDGAIVGIVVGSVTALLVVILLSFLLFRKYRIMPQSATPSPQILPEIRSRSLRQETENRVVDDGVSRSVNSEDGNGNNGLIFFKERSNFFGFEDLLRASAEVMGKDSKLGSTYKAYLDGGNVVVVKRLKNLGVSVEEFTENVEKLGNLEHENLFSPKGYFCGKEEKLLVYEYMPVGSLSAALHGTREAAKQELNWEFRTKIAFQVAHALKHLHSNGIIHGNIKSSNILLKDREYNAYVSEFGITQLHSSNSSLNSAGYTAPEVTKINQVSQQADVYSFGVVILELLLGKAPINALTGAKFDLPKRGISMAEGKLELDVFDPELIKNNNIKEKVFQFLFVAISCTSQDPEGRPSMDRVTGLLKTIYLSSKQVSFYFS